jgi:peptidoglycan/xylan/chitin deacetylase (PgdA/CDA1 family)
MGSYKIKKTLEKLLVLSKSINFFWRRLPKGLYVFNYHRIGEAAGTKFDRAVFSCSTRAFEQHLITIKEKFIVIDTEQLIYLTQHDKFIDNRYAIITFDDGYIDNYHKAFPLLKKHNLCASFYIATDFIDLAKIPWWDEIAFLLRHSVNQTYCLIGTNKNFSLVENKIDKVIQQIMTAIKLLTTHNVLDVLNDIKVNFPEANLLLNNIQQKESQKLFMTWSQIKEMSDNGMEIGSHTISHRILSQLSIGEQQAEISHSKSIIEKNINKKVNSLAYPVGRYHCYNFQSEEAAKEAGYQIAFNNEAGFHRSVTNHFAINRYCIASDDTNDLKLGCLFS